MLRKLDRCKHCGGKAKMGLSKFKGLNQPVFCTKCGVTASSVCVWNKKAPQATCSLCRHLIPLGKETCPTCYPSNENLIALVREMGNYLGGNKSG